MKEFFPILAASPLFSGVTEDELVAMLTCLAAKTEQFPKDVFLLHPGDTVEFDIPFSRQQLADFLAVERSGLSLELGKMKKEGLLDYHKEHFVLNI